MTARRPLSLLLLGAALLLTACPDNEPAGPPEPTGPDAKIRAEVVRIVDELRADASKIRGLAWKSKVEADLLTRPQLGQRLEQMMKDDLDPKEYERDLKVMRRLGLLSPEQDPIEMTKKYYALGIMGFYDTKTKKLYLIDGLTGDAQRPAILHELIHALEDQYVDIDKAQEAIKDDADGMFAFKCVIEGSAETARMLYEKEHPEYGRMYLEEQAKTAAAGDLEKALEDMPAILYVPSQLEYLTGPAFVGRYVAKAVPAGDARAAYASGMAKLFEDLPVSEEQVMHPGKFVTEHRDLPRRVTWPTGLAAAAGDGWTALDRESFGELDLAFWLDRWLGANAGRVDASLAATGRYWSDAARTASEGWDGAWLQVLQYKGDPRAYAVASAWDTPKDALEAGEAFFRAAKAQYGKTFKGGEWVERDGVRTSTFEGAYGLARIEVKGDEVRLVDGLPLEALDKVFAELRTAMFERDAKDTWTPENAPDPTRGADWRDEKAGIGWKKPAEGWRVGTDGVTTTLKKEALEIRVRVIPAGMAVVGPAALAAIAEKYPDLDLDKPPVVEAKVAGKEAARLEFDSAVKDAAKDAPKRHVVAVLLPLDDRTLLVQASADVGAWPAVSKDFEAALSGIVVRE